MFLFNPLYDNLYFCFIVCCHSAVFVLPHPLLPLTPPLPFHLWIFCGQSLPPLISLPSPPLPLLSSLFAGTNWGPFIISPMPIPSILPPLLLLLVLLMLMPLPPPLPPPPLDRHHNHHHYHHHFHFYHHLHRYSGTSGDAMVRSAEFSQLAAQISSLTSSFHQDDPLSFPLDDPRKYNRSSSRCVRGRAGLECDRRLLVLG